MQRKTLSGLNFETKNNYFDDPARINYYLTVLYNIANIIATSFDKLDLLNTIELATHSLENIPEEELISKEFFHDISDKIISDFEEIEIKFTYINNCFPKYKLNCHRKQDSKKLEILIHDDILDKFRKAYGLFFITCSSWRETITVKQLKKQLSILENNLIKYFSFIKDLQKPSTINFNITKNYLEEKNEPQDTYDLLLFATQQGILTKHTKFEQFPLPSEAEVLKKLSNKAIYF